jgi:quercetin dioxygenase-like cupin family protein
MSKPAYIYLESVLSEASVPENGILSRTLQNDDHTKVILFSFAPGQELSAHTAPFPATLFFVKGSATLKLGEDLKPAKEGTFAYMEPFLEHGIKAETEVVMLLTMVKGARQAAE